MVKSQAAKTTEFTSVNRGGWAVAPLAVPELTPEIPRQIGDYRVLRELGSGGMAETYVAARDNERRCIKRLLPWYARRAEIVAQFACEARILFALEHPNIVRALEFGASEGNYYMVLELVSGVDLNQLLSHLAAQGRKLSLRTALFITRKVCLALAHAHALSQEGRPLALVHRDVTPSNVLISTRGEVKLADFGIARVSGNAAHTRPGHAKGKSGHMAPEQITGDAIDGRADLFAVGVLLHQLLFGVLPFSGGSDYELMRRIVQGERSPLPEGAHQIPRPVFALLDRLLETNREARPSSAQEVADELAHLGASDRGMRELGSLAAHAQRALPKKAADEITRSEVRATAARVSKRARHAEA